MYYAAFFAGHALVRVTGQSIVHLEKKQTDNLEMLVALAGGPSLKIHTGTYHLQLLQNADLSLDARLRPLADNGGAHATFWRAFGNYLDELSNLVVANADPDANQVVAKIAELQRVLANNKLWLSQIRNQINYQHQYGVWFPFSAPQPSVSFVAGLNFRGLANARLDYDQSKQLVQAFGSACLFISRLSYDVSHVLATTGSAQKAPFGRNWKRLNQMHGNQFQ
jgi:hypothetical protein